MRHGRIVPAKFFLQHVKGFLWSAFPSDNAKGPIRDFLSSGEPFIRPREKHCAGQSTLCHGVDMPAEHLGLLFLGMANRIHAELAQYERMLAGEILQPQKVTFEFALMMKIDVETTKVGVLRQKIFGRRISGIREERLGVDSTADLNQLLDKFNNPMGTKPAGHSARNLVAHQVTENRPMPGTGRHRAADVFNNPPAR